MNVVAANIGDVKTQFTRTDLDLSLNMDELIALGKEIFIGIGYSVDKDDKVGIKSAFGYVTDLVNADQVIDAGEVWQATTAFPASWTSCHSGYLAFAPEGACMAALMPYDNTAYGTLDIDATYQRMWEFLREDSLVYL